MKIQKNYNMSIESFWENYKRPLMIAKACQIESVLILLFLCC